MLEVVIPYFSVRLFDIREAARRGIGSFLRGVSAGDVRIVHFVRGGEVPESLLEFVRESCRSFGAVLSDTPCDPTPMRCMSVYETLIMRGIRDCVSDIVMVCPPWWEAEGDVDLHADEEYMRGHDGTSVIMLAGCKRSGGYGVEDHDGYDKCFTTTSQLPYIYDPTVPHLMRRKLFCKGGRYDMDMTGKMYSFPSQAICRDSDGGRDGSGAVLCRRKWAFRDLMGTYRKYWKGFSPGFTYRMVIPYYNRGRYIGECLGSIARQTASERIKVAVCDDGSLDDQHDALVRSVSESGIPSDRIAVVRHPSNMGIARARNSCLDLFTDCDYTICMDSDDTLCGDDAIERLDAAISGAGSPDVMVFGWECYDGTKSRISDGMGFREMMPDMNVVSVCAWNKCIRTPMVPRFDPGQRTMEDMDWSFRLYNDVSSMSSTGEVILRYRMSPDSVIRGSGSDNYSRLSMYVRGIMAIYGHMMSGRLSKREVRDSATRFMYDNTVTNLSRWGKF